VITLAVLGLIASMTTLAVRRIDQPLPDDPSRLLADSMRHALADGRVVTLQLVVRGQTVLATIHPDGSVIADSVANVDRLAGETRAR
jgi:hypothetical protein